MDFFKLQDVSYCFVIHSTTHTLPYYDDNVKNNSRNNITVLHIYSYGIGYFHND